MLFKRKITLALAGLMLALILAAGAVYGYGLAQQVAYGAGEVFFILLFTLLLLALLLKRLARAELAARHDWEQTFNSISDPACLIDTDYIIRQVNLPMVQRLGRSPAEIIGRPCYACLHQAFTPLAACPHQKLLRDGQPHRVELQLDCFGGWFDVSVAPRKDRHGNLLGSVHVCHDITERKRVAERLERINGCLLALGADYSVNIGRITALAGALLGGTCAFYNRLEGGLLSAVGRWQTPPDFNLEYKPEGHICYDLLKGVMGEDFIYVPDLRATPYAETDVNIRKYNLQSYLGQVIRGNGQACGVLCVAFQHFYKPSGDDKYLLGILAAALGVEENRQRAQNLILAGNQQFQDMVETTNDCIWEVDPEGRYTYVSPRIKDMLGYAPEEALGKTPFDFMSAPDAQYIEGIFRTLAAGRKPLAALQNVNVHKSGRLVVLETSGIPFFGSPGEFKGYRGANRDITARVKAEKKAAMLAHAIDTAHHGCLVLSSDYNIVFANDYALTKLGFDPGELSGSHLFSLCASEERTQEISEALAAAGRWMGESALRKKDGAHFPALISVSATRLIEKLESEQYILLFQDISAQKEMQTQLLASEKLAVMGRLVADVSHELNNPLAIIIGGTQLILSRLDKKEMELKDQLERVLRNARRCKNILANLLSYGRTVGKKIETVNLAELLQEAVADVGYQYNMSGIEVAFNPADPAGLAVAGNRAALLSVFVNLIRNARQAMGPQGRLTIALGKQNGLVQIAVQDTGVGLTEEQTANLFKPFASGWQQEEGSGLGLATSLGIIATHGGNIAAASAGQGKGATFTITLPEDLDDGKLNDA